VITEVADALTPGKNEQTGNFGGSFLYPGFINAHDHLEMNLYPRLGTPPYEDYVAWAKDIYDPAKSPIREIEKLPIQTRLLWGGLKNLIAGATTVVHHNPWHRTLARNFPVKVLKTAWAHSLAFEKQITTKFPRSEQTPFVVHAAEGTSSRAASEIPQLKILGLLEKNTVLVHVVAAEKTSIDMMANADTSMVWCPASNLFMFHETAPIMLLKNRIPIALGSDSTLTGSPTLLHEIHVAASTKNTSARELFSMVSDGAAGIFNLPPPTIKPGNAADLFVARVIDEDYYENVLHLNPGDISMVITDGVPMLSDADAVDSHWKSLKYEVRVDNVLKRSAVDVPSLKAAIEKKIPRDILESNPLWNLIKT
jgi:cytosine/adenosine deaminase-related metal-dependent hydrolase